MNLIPPKYKKFQDYCTNFPDKLLGDNYGQCCYVHDVMYSNYDMFNFAINHNVKMTRLRADNILFGCVRKKRGIVVALLMWIGVRLFGGSHYRRK